MAQIIPKLNLNKTPTVVEPNSLVFAKNIRLDVDGSIHRDYGVFPMSVHKGNNTNYTVNYLNILNRILSDINFELKQTENPKDYIKTVYNNLRLISGETVKDSTNAVLGYDGTYKIVGTISNSNEFYIFIYGNYTISETATGEKKLGHISSIIKYDEKEDKFHACNCNWNWSGGTITGCVVNNLLGEKILNIGEKDAANSVPLKCINLNTSSINDDERIYTQTPNIPITNLNYIGSFNYSIPNGVYQFFIRYKIRDNFYTDWFPASKELFAGNTNNTDTSFGTVKFLNTHKDSDDSFKFSVEHLFANQSYNYENFQVGFIVSHDDSIVARAWKHFDFTVNSINFDYNPNDAYEVEVIDLLKNAYQIYDVGNITSFKNKLYIANYKETDFNENHQALANQIGIDIVSQTSAVGAYGDYEITSATIKDETVIAGLKIGTESVAISGQNGIIDRLLKICNNNNEESVKDAISDAIGDNNTEHTTCGARQWDIQISGNKMPLEFAKGKFKVDYKGSEYSNFKFETNVQRVKVGGTYVIVDSNKETFLNNILSAIYSKVRYLNENCIFVNNAGIEDNQIDIDIVRNCSCVYTRWISYGNRGTINSSNNNYIDPDDTSNPNLGRDDEELIGGGRYVESTVNSTYTQTITLKLSGFKNKYKSSNIGLLLRYTTLIPYQKYKFYIHYIKQNGEITNGYYCNGKTGGIKTVPFKESVDSVIYPKFTNITLPDGYVACFFSIVHSENNVATVFDIDTSNTNGEATCMDINVGLMNGTKTMTIKQGYGAQEGGTVPVDPNIPVVNPDYPIITPTEESEITPLLDTPELPVSEIKDDKAKYYYSSDTSNPRYFGAAGIVTFDKTSGINGGGTDGKPGNKVAYIVKDYTISETEDTQLTKCTPFINPLSLSKEENINVYDSFDDMNLLGFICEVKPLDRTKTINYFTDTTTAFYKKINNSDDDNSFELIELKNHSNDTTNAYERLSALSFAGLSSSPSKYIYSNYNLNYLTLDQEPQQVYRTYYIGSSEGTPSKTYNLVLRLFTSATISSIYVLPSMYKSYTRKTYSIYRRNEITNFNNTIRSSRLEEDEASINIYKFDANDYYNIPTNRGLIVNLISIGDAILVHTEDSMFKFSGSNTLQSSDGEIQPTENNVFDTGVAEIFGSDFGFAGLQYKTDHIITENGYIFFDRDSRIVYMYSGQGQIVKVSDSIEKLFRHRPIKTIRFANDYYNNRFFMSIMFYEDYYVTEDNKQVLKQRYYPVTLSFNVTDNIKSFVSLHDFYYSYAFNTKTKCYFLAQDNQDICTIDKYHKGYYTKLELKQDNLYIQKATANILNFSLADNDMSAAKDYIVNSYDSIIDIIDNSSYETIKTLNAVNWCGYKLNSEFRNISETNDKTLNMVEEVNYDIPCKYIRVYSDTCLSPLCDCTQRSNDKSISALDYPKYPFYNQGSWIFNYFRNILNSNNNKTKYKSDDNSLIEGKYFVVRFGFDSDFKIETINLNYNIK